MINTTTILTMNKSINKSMKVLITVTVMVLGDY